MTRYDARLEAQRRWGANGGVWEKGINPRTSWKQVGRRGRIGKLERMVWVAGEGRTWEEAFAAADVKEGVAK
mgnify:CR=1 FL=1